MEANLAITIIGSIASIIGAIISLFQASRSKNSAEEAEKVKNHLISHRVSNELVTIQASCKQAVTSMEKYGPAATSSSLQGVNHQRDAKDVQDFLQAIAENREHFEHGTENDADRMCTELNPVLDQFSQAQTAVQLKEEGKKIYLSLLNFLSIMKRSIDRNREDV